MVVGIKNGSTNTDTDCKEFRTKFPIKALCLEIGCSKCTSFDRGAGECVYFTNPLLAQISTACLASDAKPIDGPSEGASPIYLPCYNFHTNVFISKICQDHACQICANASHGKGNCLRFTWPVDATIGCVIAA
ncbi:hypothetical protein BDZ90DRAFT_262161 [Jaminaea rosea]|uniref:Uncharacterized protein n=1 Tax=Jaminaea rosea TaxID=1569628 RepID=A0A316UNM4_9BASI|nr:hypothetical protein BDZ90DRAFT_262161 [Jaminaea rosea]PWN25513.1 hypothetical protein BDZ90DRAFT_262161 [Jaminaea rosea]